MNEEGVVWHTSAVRHQHRRAPDYRRKRRRPSRRTYPL